ncbi:MAG TPA: ectonucleotide pyrophosphatase/phosphodiesterase [Vicinamibacterales bacterium]|jgi:predicted AlkP superfamily pyrophosphatase or phosphodiesterase
MRFRSRYVLGLTAVLLALAAALLPGSAAQPRAGSARHVVIISLDGFPSWALDDPYLPVPTIRALAARGAIAKTMRPVNPTVTWPNHTSFVTGVTPAKHRVLYNGILIRDAGMPPRIEPWRDKKEMVRAKTLYDAAHERGLTTAQVDWVAIQNAPTITWAFAERPDPKSLIARELVDARAITAEELETFATRNILWRDHIWTAAAAHIIRKHRPNLMLFHLLNLDSTHHRYGPRSPAAATAMAHLDSQVRTIVDVIDAAGASPRTAIFVVADHGFKLVKRQIRANAALAKAGLLTVRDGKIVSADAYVVPEGGSAIAFVTSPDPDGGILKRLRAALAGIEGIARIVEPADYSKYGLPSPADSDQIGQLFLIASEGYAYTAAFADPVVVDAPEGSLGAHGYVASDPDLGALFVAAGAGIARGVKIEAMENVDVAPTAAHLLGLSLEGADGRVLKELLAPTATK